MAVILKDTVPPITEVAKLGYASVAVYSLLYQSAYQDQRYDKRSFAQRRDCGGTTNWSHKAIADTLGMGKSKMLKCINLLLDHCFIQCIGLLDSSKGSKHRIYRVVHPSEIENVRNAMAFMPLTPSDLAKNIFSHSEHNSR